MCDPDEILKWSIPDRGGGATQNFVLKIGFS